MKKFFFFLTAVMFSTASVSAQNLKNYSDRKAGFSLKYPGSWKKTANQGGVNLLLTSKDETANFQLVTSDVEAGTSTRAFLSEVEKAAGTGQVNQAPADMIPIPAEELAKYNAEEGALGIYEINQEGMTIYQQIRILRKGTRIFAIIMTFSLQNGEAQKDMCLKIADSFKSLK